jgi:hypothetical protein
MVWHAYMLNPRGFYEDCVRFGLLPVWTAGLPWAAIDLCIDNGSFEYSPSAAAQKFFVDTTGLAWANLEDAPWKALTCPYCSETLSCPWTTCQTGASDRRSDDALKSFLATGTGFADKEFWLVCTRCFESINHDRLRVAKFRNDVEDLLQNDFPMPGTILSLHGALEKGPKKSRALDVLYPSNMLLGMLRQTPEEKAALFAGAQSVDDIKRTIETYMQRVPGLPRKSRHALLLKTSRAGRVAIRRMMSRYWDNSSIFALDLVGAVVRQGSFIEKMHNIDWLHSPALRSTMNRLLVKYGCFFAIMAAHPGHVAVPTLDVDLAWHTHQLSPPRYYNYSMKQTKRFIDHDDKIDEGMLSTAFEWTSKQYQKMFKVCIFFHLVSLK